MKTEWYCEILGDVVGPLTSSQLLAKVRAGEINADTPVRKDDSQWVPAMEVSGLFAAAEKAVTSKTTGFICPYCGESVPKAPTECPNCERYLNRVVPVREKTTVNEGSTVEENQERLAKKFSVKKAKSLWRFWSGD